LIATASRAPKRGRVDRNGYDTGKKINGKKRYILVDTAGSLLRSEVCPADVRDRDDGLLVPATVFGLDPFVRKLFAEAGYQGPKFANGAAVAFPGLSVEIVKRSDAVSGFEVLPCRWVVE
jgi:hypothetical protein